MYSMGPMSLGKRMGEESSGPMMKAAQLGDSNVLNHGVSGI